MDSTALLPRITHRLYRIVLTLFALSTGALSLKADPEITATFFDEGVAEEIEGVTTLSGPKGNQCVRFTIETNLDVNLFTFDKEDIVVVGVGSGNADVTIPVSWVNRGGFNRGPDDRGRFSVYELGPLDATQNGEFAINLVKDQIGGNSVNFIPAGEIFSFTQNITDPVPEVLGVHSFEVAGDPITPDGETINITGPYGFSTLTFKIDYNKDTDYWGIGFGAIEVVSPGGEAITASPRDWEEKEDRNTVTYRYGKRLDSAANGTYTIRAAEGLIPAVGKADPPITLPAGDLETFTQDITDPAPKFLANGDLSFEFDNFPIVTDNSLQLRLFFNLAVDVDSLDQNNIIVTGISPENEGQVLTPGESWRFDYRVNDNVSGDGYIDVTYSFLDELKEAFNGDWKVEIKEGEIRSKSDSELFVPGGEIGTFKQIVIDPFSFIVEGRVYTEKEGTTPSILIDDGWETDLGLIFAGMAILETPPNGGIGYQNIEFPYDTIIYDELETDFSPEILAINTFDGENVSFEVEGNRTAEGQFPIGSTFTVVDSPGNNETYTVTWAGRNNLNGVETTQIQVEETIESSDAGGRIVKGPYAADISIDGTVFNASFAAEDIPTYGDLLTKLNELFDGAAVIVKIAVDRLRIESCTYGPDSKVLITEPTDGTGLFSNLGAYADTPVDGNLDWENAWQSGNEYTVDFVDEDDWGIMRFGEWAFWDTPGIFRIRQKFGSRDTGEVDDFGVPISVDVPPPPQIATQALGDPNREGEPLDHMMYLFVKRENKGQTFTVNFSYFEDNTPPHLMYDEIKVLRGSSGNRLNVLANDGLPAGNNGDLTIIGLGIDEGPTFLDDDPPTELFTNSQGGSNRSWTDGEYVYYDSNGLYELFYYIVEDGEGNRDWAEIYIDPVDEITNQFFANPDFATVPITVDRARINVLANDSVSPGRSKDNLIITGISTPTEGGTISYQGTDVFYTPPADFVGTDSFEYTMTDGFSGSATTLVEVIVTNSPVPDGQRALLNMLLRLFGGSRGGSAVFEFWNNHISEFDYLILNQDEGSVSPKAKGQVSLSRRHNGGTAETEANWKAILNMAEAGIAATLAGQGDSLVVTQEFVDLLMDGIEEIEERASPEFKADLEVICEMTNDFQDLVGKTYGEGFDILGLPPEDISIPNLALKRINDVISITTWDVTGLALKLWKSNNLQPDSWEEVENAQIEKEGAKATISDPDGGNEDIFYRVTSEVEDQ